MKQIILITFITVLAFASLGKACKGKDKEIYKNLDDVGIPKSEAKFKHTFVSPGGVKVLSTVPVPAVALLEIDDGISRTIRQHAAVYPTWEKNRNLNEWQVLFVEPRAINQQQEPGSPAIHVRGIQSCGTVIGIGYKEAAERETQFIVLPHQQGQNWRFLNYLNNCAAHESDHLFEFKNDYRIFTIWNSNDIHPRPFHLCGRSEPNIPC